MLVGEVRAADVREAGLVDKNTGLKSTVWLITYFVELMRDHDFKFAKITRRVPAESHDPAAAPVGAEKGKCYAFEIESCEKKHDFILARMSAAMPSLIGEEDALSVDAPSGAATGSAASNLVYLQTTPRTP
jgi:hypothetical protein